VDPGKLASYLSRALSEPDLRIDSLHRIPGGASRATWSVDVSGGSGTRGLIVRMDPESSLLESNRAVEFAMYRSFWRVPGVPVPEPLLTEDDPERLGHTFFVMARVDGRSETSIPDEVRGAIGAQKMAILAAISTADWQALGLGGVLEAPAPSDCWSRELAMWEKVLDDNDLGPMPITRAAIRYLRRNPPPPPERIAVVHADYRTGNFLYEGDRITAVLDWEMAHLGDPHEDLAWTFTRNWRWNSSRPDLIGGVLTRDEAIAIWEKASGLAANHDALRWWELFSNVKANAIWVTGAAEYAAGRTREILLPLIPWIFVNRQEAWMLDDMGVA
jgi:aminoglycoside phosphotransferase (APT) family kinase protein